MNAKIPAISRSFFALVVLLLTILSGLAVPLQTARAATITITPAASPTPTDNDYTRINNAIQAAAPTDVIKLLGTFDWTEANAAASWALGSDGVVSAIDDYSIYVPANLNNVTLTADNLGDATIQGPGDLAGANLEGVLVFDGGDNQGWTISNIRFLDFDLSIGMFSGAGGADAYNDTEIVNNYIRIASDLNATVAPADVNQNIGIHFAFGTNQIIADNTIDIQGNAVSDSGGSNFASDIGMQSNTSGGAVYDGLLIADNIIRVLNAQSADPQVIIGIWENSHGHTGNVTVSGNLFINQAPGNNPATNLQRAFRVTSHSSPTTTVRYSNNSVDGANIGFQWIAGSNFSAQQPVVLTRNTIMNGGTGVQVQSQGQATLSFNRIVGNTVGLANTDGTVTASNNWWGCNGGPGTPGCDTFTGIVDANLWLVLRAIAMPSTINAGGTSTITADMRQNSDVAIPAGGPLPLIPVTFSATQGTMAPPSGTITSGQETSTFTATTTSDGTGCATVDNQLICANVNVIAANADLSITKTDGVTTATPGGSVTYTITASNAGPDPATATVADTFPASLTVTWTCVGAGGGTCTAAGAGNINDAVNLPVGGSVTYTASATINAAATGSLSNTATVGSSFVIDPNPANNSATDTDTLTPSANLAITKTDGVTTATSGGSVTYTIVASNAGPSNAPGATVADTFPAWLTVTWTCVGAGGGTCTAAGAGNINDTVNLPAGGSVTYTASATISPSATGTLSNTATVAAPGGVTDPVPGNNSATDSDTVAASADLAITKTDGVTTATPGGSVTYTITASNAGPSNATGATVADTFPASLTVTWTCVGAGGGTCTAAGAGNINDVVNLPAGGSVTYTASATISPSATGTLANTATVAAPGGVTDPNPANNSATDSDTLDLSTDLAITKTDGVTTATPGGSVTYTITASNAGPSNATGATVADTFPASLTATWTCVGAGGGTCTAAGAGNINDVVNLPAGGSVTYTVSATISPSATGTLSNTATVSAPAKVSDPNPANNSATDTDTLTSAVTVTINQAAGQSDPDFADSASKKINFTATFSEPVSGFTASDISFAGTTLSGTLSAIVTQVTPFDGTTYNVAVKGMIPKGTVFVSIPANKVTSVATGNPNLASTSIDNNITVDYVLVEFGSTASKDGWVLESTETNGVGGSLDSTAISSRVGDDASDRQYRSVLDFSTGSIPDSAVLFSINLRIIEHSITGTNPFTTHGLLKSEIKSGFFGTGSALQNPDFEDAPDKSACNFETVPEILEAIGVAYRCVLFNSAFSSINLTGSTQFRLRFATDDNDDMSTDIFNFYSGDYGGATQRPRLFIKYYIPPTP